MLKYTTVNHQFRKDNGLSLNEYCFCDMIYHLSVNPENRVTGWCYMSRETMANELGISKQAIIAMIERLITKGFINKHEETKHLQTTSIWNNGYFFAGKESLPPVNKNIPLVKKLDQSGKETLPDCGKETLPNNNNLDINNNINNNIRDEESKKEVSFKIEVSNYNNLYSEQTLTQFIEYWTEKNKKGTMRYEDQKFFDIKRRLKTWSNNEISFSKEKSFAKKERIENFKYDKNSEKNGNLF